jgi:phosphomethylpyrimidine synthase
MNAPESLPLFETLPLTREPFPASAKVHVPGQAHPQLRVPMRDVTLSNGEVVSLYDTSGPYTDPQAAIDVRRGLASVRGAWIEARGDTEPYEGRTRQALDDGAKHEAREAERIDTLRREAAALQRTPRRARAGGHHSGNVTQMHYARRGIITPEMEFIAIRENLGRERMAQTEASRDSLLHQHSGASVGASIPSYVDRNSVG